MELEKQGISVIMPLKDKKKKKKRMGKGVGTVNLQTAMLVSHM